jgi:hypothetical protein
MDRKLGDSHNRNITRMSEIVAIFNRDILEKNIALPFGLKNHRRWQNSPF